jgi:hypothetical protein
MVSRIVGCACPTNTVTDYVVSCAGTGTLSCSTISSTAVTGCYVTATETTTGAYCVTNFSIDPDDQGDEPPATITNSYSYVTKTLPESVVISNTAYTVTGGSIVVSGTTLSVPTAITGSTIITVGGYTATAIPGFTGLVPSFPQQTVAPTTTTNPTTPTSTPPPVTSKPPQSTGMVVAAYSICQIGVCEYQWEIYPVNPNTTPLTFPGCSTNGAIYSSVVDKAPNPTAIPKLGPFKIDGKSNCFYDPTKGVTCVGSPSQSCQNCFPDNDPTHGFCSGDGVTCDENMNEGYNADVYCFW